MSNKANDTHPRMEEIHLDLLRQAPAWRKLEMVSELSEAVRQLNLAGLRERHPQDNEEQLLRMYADLVLGEELAKKAFGPLSE